MTPEAFEKLLRNAPGKKFVAAINELTDDERKAFAKVVKAVRKDINKYSANFRSGESTDEWRKRMDERQRWQKRNPHVEGNITFGILACGTAAEAHRIPLWEINYQDRELVGSVMMARNPSWFDTWANKRLDGEFPDINWKMVREFYEGGYISKPTSEGYINLFIQAMRGYEYRKPETYIPTSERLLSNQEFLDDEIWRIFEFENAALTQDWHARSKEAPKNYETWPEAIVILANDGHLDRDRLLNTCVESMNKDMKQNQLSAYGKLHDALKPTKEELAARQAEYLDLLVSPVGPVLSFAVRSLAKLHRANSLDAKSFVGSARPIFAHKAKGNAMQVLKITDKIYAADEVNFDELADLAIAALAHESPDVQELALDIIEKGIESAAEETRDELVRHIPFLSAKLQTRAHAFLGEEQDEVAEVDEGDTELAVAFTSRFLDIPGVIDGTKLEPIETRDQLLELTAQLIEKVDSADQIEVLLHGISTFGRDRTGNFGKLAAPLVQRIQEGQTSANGLRGGFGNASVSLIDLVMSWFTGRNFDSRSTPYYEETPKSAFAAARIREIQSSLLGDGGAPILSFPSYTTGWIEPRELVQRVVNSDEKQDVRDFDLMQALLRLGPGNREEALADAAGIGGRTGRLLRFALGGDEEPGVLDVGAAHIWFCAARARDPDADARKMLGPVAARIPRMPGLRGPDEWRWRVKSEVRHKHRFSNIELDESLVTRYDEGFRYRRDWTRKLKRKLREPKWRKWPTAGLRAWPKQTYWAMYEYGSPWGIEWLAMQHPADMETYMSIAVFMLDARSDENTSSWTPVHAFLPALYDQTRRWGEMSNLAICLGLLSKSSDARGYAIDAIIPAIESGHADAEELALVFAKLFHDGAYKINRFGPSMTSVLDVSSVHKRWTALCVDRLVSEMEKPPRGAHFLYEAALESMMPLGLKPSDAMLEKLKTHKGSSKVAKLARELSSLDGARVRE